MLIGLTGKKRRGKNTVADYLVSKYGFNAHGFADKVKAYAYAQNPIIQAFVYNGRVIITRLQEIVDSAGWEKAKEIPEVRALLQRTGTEGGREIFLPLAPNKDFWIKLLFAELDSKYDYYETGLPLHKEFQSNIVIFDCRFDNEAEAIKERGGHVILVESNREGLPEPDSHASEAGINPKLVDGTLHNDSTPEELYKGIDLMLEFMGFTK